MSPEIALAQIAEIDGRAEVERARVRFDINLLEQNEEHYRQILNPFPLDESEDQDLVLYSKFVKQLDNLESEALRTSGVVIYRDTVTRIAKSIDKDILLGWMRFSEPYTSEDEVIDLHKEYTHFKFPTELGIQIINERRAAQGKCSVEESRKQQTRLKDKIWGRTSA
jgi:hypothetical protein